jgi:glycosyltransferase involved in cell wall biosynthesis
VGVLEPRKNHALLMEVLRRLHHEGIEVDLLIIGREGWKWINPAEMTEYTDLRSRVRILTDVPEPDLAEFYRNAAVFAYPSFYEGFGMPILEAMACGAPVVASDSSSLPEVGGDAALYANPHDPDSFTAQVRQVLQNNVIRERMIAAGIERAREFSWRRTAVGTVKVYSNICETNRKVDAG